MFDRYADYIIAERRYSKLTLRNYLGDLNNFRDFIGNGSDFDPQLVTYDDVRAFIVHMQKELNYSASNINRALSSLRGYFKWLRGYGEIDHDPMARIKSLRVEHKLPNFIPESKMASILPQLDQMVQSASPEDQLWVLRDVVILMFLYSTGIRRAELRAIQFCDIESDYSLVRVRGKGDKVRVIPIIDKMQHLLRDYVDKNRCEKIWNSPEECLFLSKRGGMLRDDEVNEIVNRVLGQVGVHGKRSPHLLRHTFATHLLNGGADMRDIQELMGHSSLVSTQVYTHNSIVELRKIYNKAHPRGRKSKKEE